MSKGEANSGLDNNDFTLSTASDNKPKVNNGADSSFTLDGNESSREVNSSYHSNGNNESSNNAFESNLTTAVESSSNRHSPTGECDQISTLTTEGSPSGGEANIPGGSRGSDTQDTAGLSHSDKKTEDGTDVKTDSAQDRDLNESNGNVISDTEPSKSTVDYGAKEDNVEQSGDKTGKEGDEIDRNYSENLKEESDVKTKGENVSDKPNEADKESVEKETSDKLNNEQENKTCTGEAIPGDNVNNADDKVVSENSEVNKDKQNDETIPNEDTNQGDNYEDDFEEADTDEQNGNNSSDKQYEDTDTPETVNNVNATEDNLNKIEQDLKQAKDDWEKSVSDDKEETGDESPSDDIGDVSQDPEVEVTKVVVDDEGIPKVLVTTVPDRPPSSQASDTEREEPEVDINTPEEKAKHESDSKVQIDTEKVDENTESAKEDITVSEERKEGIYSQTKDSVSKNDITENNDLSNTDELHSKRKQEEEKKERRDSNESVEIKTNRKPRNSLDNGAENREQSEMAEENRPDKMDTDVKTGETEAFEGTDSETPKTNDGEPEPNETVAPEDQSKNEKEEVAPAPEVKPVIESPLEKLLKRNVEIDGTIESIKQLEQNVVTLLTSMKDVMCHYNERLKLQTLKDMTDDIGKFRGDFQSVNEAFRTYSSMSSTINQRLKELRHVTEDVKTQISRKFVSEDLSTWVDVTPEQEKGIGLCISKYPFLTWDRIIKHLREISKIRENSNANISISTDNTLMKLCRLVKNNVFHKTSKFH